MNKIFLIDMIISNDVISNYLVCNVSDTKAIQEVTRQEVQDLSTLDNTTFYVIHEKARHSLITQFGFDKVYNLFELYKPTPFAYMTKNIQPTLYINDTDKLDVHTKRLQSAIPLLEHMQNNSKHFTSFEKKIQLLNCKINTKGIPVQYNEINKLLEGVELLKQDQHNEVQLKTGLDPLNDKTFLEWLNSKGYKIPNLNNATIKNTAFEVEIDKIVKMYKASKTTVDKRLQSFIDNTISETVVKDKETITIYTLKNQYQYYGAKTGRFSAKGVQVHNLERPTVDLPTLFYLKGDLLASHVFNEDVDYLVASNAKSLLRAMIQPNFVNQELLIIDFKQIEMRIACYMAGVTEINDMFIKGVDVYTNFAKQIYNVKKPSNLQRNIAKIAMLGLQYGMGYNAFTKHLQANFNNNLSDVEIKKIYDTWQNTFANIIKYWKNLKKIIIDKIKALKYTKKDYISLSYNTQQGLQTTIYYNKPEIDNEGNITYMNDAGVRKPLYSPLIFENLVQAIARDILCSYMINLDNLGLDIRMHTHDEVVCIVDKGFDNLGDYVKDNFNRFAKDYKMPLDITIKTNDFYC